MRIIFVHDSKCAGTTMNEVLNNGGLIKKRNYAMNLLYAGV